jgi:chorismate mutase-like protein
MSQPPVPVTSADLAPLRDQIDALDKQLLQLLNQRARVAEQVGEIKRAEGSPFFRPDRVAQVIQKITSANPGPPNIAPEIAKPMRLLKRMPPISTDVIAICGCQKVLAQVRLALVVFFNDHQLATTHLHRAASCEIQAHHQTHLGLLAIGLQRAGLAVNVRNFQIFGLCQGHHRDAQRCQARQSRNQHRKNKTTLHKLLQNS